MSLQLTTLVPVLDGTNYLEWSAKMRSFLMSQGQWKCVKKALGNLLLRLHHSIASQYNDMEDPSTLWGKLLEKYGVARNTRNYINFKAIMDTKIPNNSDPSPALDKMLSLFLRLKENQLEIPDKVARMIVMSKAPQSMETIIQIYTIAKEDKTTDLNESMEAMRKSWDVNKRAGNSKNQQHANRLSAVKPAPQQPQEFSQQQQSFGQQRGGFRGRGKGRRGKCRSGKNSQQQLQQQQLQAAEQPPYQSFAPHPSQLPSPPPPPQWIQANPPPVHPNTMGYFASAIKTGRPLPPTPPVNPETGFYGKTFGKALNLTHRLGVTPTTETVKTLEKAVVAHESHDPHPNKRARTESLPRGEPQGSKGKARASNDDKVSLDFTDDEPAGPLFSDEKCGAESDDGDGQGYQINDTMDYDVEGEFTQTGFEPDFRQVDSSSLSKHSNHPQQLEIIAICKHNTSLSCGHECDCEQTKDWLMDSRASAHFTPDINDFIKYQELTEPMFVQTANLSAQVKGKGTILLVLSTNEVVRITPVFHIPTLSCQLLSMGVFLQAGLKTIGSRNAITVLKELKPVLKFLPRQKNGTIYVIKSKVQEAHTIATSIYGINFDIMHRRLAHPSKEVLLKSRKHLKDFPEIEFPTEQHICPGCAQ